MALKWPLESATAALSRSKERVWSWRRRRRRRRLVQSTVSSAHTEPETGTKRVRGESWGRGCLGQAVISAGEQLAKKKRERLLCWRGHKRCTHLLLAQSPSKTRERLASAWTSYGSKWLPTREGKSSSLLWKQSKNREINTDVTSHESLS